MSTGRFVWYELMTTDAKAAMDFYTHVVGWKTQPFAESPDPYTMWVSEQGPMGGVMELNADMRSRKVPPHWMGHVGVDDVDASVAQVKELGGMVHFGPLDIPTVGRFAVVADPQGAVLSLFASSTGMKPPAPGPGQITWNELYATDAAADLKFYEKLVGWHVTAEHDMGPMGKYLLFGDKDGKAIGGAMNKPPMIPHAVWGYYANVTDLDAAVLRVKEKGGSIANGPMEVPGGDRVANIVDPQGVHFSLHEFAKKG